jgi:hypothetical protein
LQSAQQEQPIRRVSPTPGPARRWLDLYLIAMHADEPIPETRKIANQDAWQHFSRGWVSAAGKLSRVIGAAQLVR